MSALDIVLLLIALPVAAALLAALWLGGYFLGVAAVVCVMVALIVLAQFIGACIGEALDIARLARLIPPWTPPR